MAIYSLQVHLQAEICHLSAEVLSKIKLEDSQGWRNLKNHFANEDFFPFPPFLVQLDQSQGHYAIPGQIHLVTKWICLYA